LKQLSIYDNEYLDHFNSSDQIKAGTQPSATCHQLSVTSTELSPTALVNKIEETELVEEKVFPANVTEIVLTKDKIDSIQLVLPMLINLHQEKRWLAWIDPPIQLLKEWQKTHNDSALNDIMILRSNDNLSVFELSKRALTAGTCHAVIAWTNNLSQDQFSKLETASSKGNSHGIILKSRLQTH
jgi:cell division inhibitor SulA